MIALRRINKFLMSEDLKSDYIAENKNSVNAMTVRNGNFYWLKEEDKKKLQEEEKQKEDNYSSGNHSSQSYHCN